MKMNRMRSVLLLVLSLLTGSEAKSNVNRCPDGWTKFTYECQKPKQKCEHEFDCSQKPTIQSSVKDVCRMFLQYDTKDNLLSLFNKQLSEEQKVEVEGCKEPFPHTAYKDAKTNIVCNKSGNKHSIMFFCKDHDDICEDILPTKSNGRFTLTDNNSNISISNVSLKDDGVYWCGVKLNKGKIALTRIELKVEDITNFTRTPTIGQNFTYWCDYKKSTLPEIFICKGEDPSMCQTVVDTRFSMTHTKGKKLTITLSNVTAEDSGTYWCGAESSDHKSRKTFLHRFVMTAVAPSTSTVPSTTQTTSAVSHGKGLKSQGDGSSLIIIVVVCVTLLVLLFVLILIVLYKRFSSSKSTNTGAAAQQNKEDYINEEIQEPLHQPDSDNALTASFPMNPPTSLCYSVIEFKNSSDYADIVTSVLRRSCTHCEYSNVKYRQNPTIQMCRGASLLNSQQLTAGARKRVLDRLSLM